MTPYPYNKYSRMPRPALPPVTAPPAVTAPQGLQLSWQPMPEEDLSGYGELSKQLGGYLKGRRDQESRKAASLQGTAGKVF